MIRNTFCHLPNFDLESEKNLWKSGIRTWYEVHEKYATSLPDNERNELVSSLRASDDSIAKSNPEFFAELLPTCEHWRLFREFKDVTAYLDIETTGLSYRRDHVTTIALYDGKEIKYYTKGVNLASFKKDIQKYGILVTYNGKTFDVPFLRNTLGVELSMPHIDLRYVLQSLGYTGGLKECERNLGIRRPGMKDIDGRFAVYLWEEYRVNHNSEALNTLLAYNITDVLNLELLLTIAYNKKISRTPFKSSNKLPAPRQPANPFKPHRETVNRIRDQYYYD